MEVYEVTIILSGRLCLCFSASADEDKTHVHDCQNVKTTVIIII